MPDLRLPRTPYTISVFDFPYDVIGIVGGYGYGVSVYNVYDYLAILVLVIEGLIGTNLYGGCRDCCSGVIRFLGNKLTENRAFSAMPSRAPKRCQHIYNWDHVPLELYV